MDSFQIDNKLSSVPGFLGVFPSDRLPSVTSCPVSFVFNTDPANRPGRHWIAVIVLSSRVEYFDATGREPVNMNYLRRLGKPVLYNNYRIQSPHSYACGLFCCDFLLRRSEGETFCEILSSFSRTSLFNDFMLLR